MIYFIEGAAQSGKTQMINNLRNAAISSGRGALIINDYEPDPDYPAHALHLAEKIVVGMPLHVLTADGPELRHGLTVDNIPWKQDPTIAVVGAHGKSKLGEIESLLPGFKEKFGPSKTVTL